MVPVSNGESGRAATCAGLQRRQEDSHGGVVCSVTVGEQLVEQRPSGPPSREYGRSQRRALCNSRQHRGPVRAKLRLGCSYVRVTTKGSSDQHTRVSPMSDGGSQHASRITIAVDANLKIPNLTVHPVDAPARRVNNHSVRWIKHMTVEAIPKPGDTVRLSTRRGPPFDATVTRVEWNTTKNLFVVSCNYAKRSITSDDHEALVVDPDWIANHLPT